jgi:excinuclease UvrABC nuclease subunit
MSEAVSSHVEGIVQLVDTEFGTKAELFAPIVVRMDARNATGFEVTKSPGVYVFIDESGRCLKVGKSHLNASKRALEHCRDNTRSKDGTINMADLVSSSNTYMLVFALQERDSLHWVLALEHYLEKALRPAIHSQRNG